MQVFETTEAEIVKFMFNTGFIPVKSAFNYYIHKKNAVIVFIV